MLISWLHKSRNCALSYSQFQFTFHREVSKFLCKYIPFWKLGRKTGKQADRLPGNRQRDGRIRTY